MNSKLGATVRFRTLATDCTINPTVFDCMSQNQNQSNYFGESQRRLAIQLTNQNSKQVHVACAKRGKTCAKGT